MICPNCGTRLPEGSTRCHFCGYTASARPTSAETAIVVVSLAAVLIAVSLLLVVVTEALEISPLLRVSVCFVIGAVVTIVYWKIIRWTNPRLARFG